MGAGVSKMNIFNCTDNQSNMTEVKKMIDDLANNHLHSLDKKIDVNNMQINGKLDLLDLKLENLENNISNIIGSINTIRYDITTHLRRDL